MLRFLDNEFTSERKIRTLRVERITPENGIANIVRLSSVKRRKMKPTHMERTIFGDASGDCLASVVKIKTGTEGAESVSVGSLSCWEHIQPLLKYYTFSQGEQVHVAAWPALDPCPDESPGFWSMSADGEFVYLIMHSTQVQSRLSALC
jgi:hypothetical protein